jgi:hypothetical protein
VEIEERGQMTTTGTEMADRQRQRADRASGAGRKQGGSRLPSASKRRRPAIAALAALLIVGGALIAGVLAVRMDERQSVVQIARDVGVGTQITKEDLVQTRVSGDNLTLIPADQAQAILLNQKVYAKVNLIQGQLLNPKQVTQTAPFGDDKATVGIALLDGRAPVGGLKSGDEVQLIRIGESNSNPQVIGNGIVLPSPAVTSKDTTLGTKSTNATLANVLIDRTLIRAVTDASGNNRIAVAVLSSGNSTEGR